MVLFGYSPEEVDKKVETARREEREKAVKESARQVTELKADHEQDVKRLKNDHQLELKQKEFELKHNADVRVKAAEDKLTKTEQDLAVAKKENEMLGKITDLNSDVIDVKELVQSLITKLPNVNISTGISAGAAPAKGGDKPAKGE